MPEFDRYAVATPIFACGLILAAGILAGKTSRTLAGETNEASRLAGSVKLGSVEGTVNYRNDRKHAWRLSRYYVKSSQSGELAEAVVALAGPTLKRASLANDSSMAMIDQKEMRFVPETIAIRVGDRVCFTNSDPQTHNISLDDPRLKFSETIANGQKTVQPFPKASGVRRPFALGCKLHSQMQGWVYVFDHPFFQVTGADGRFRLADVPPGDYRLDVAQSAGNLHAGRAIHVNPGENLKIEVVLTPADRSAQ